MTELKCALCQWAIEDGAVTATCPECGATYHAECHEENGGCGNYGCSLVPAAVEQAAGTESRTYWGAEHKDCPACGQQIQAMALRCRHCGAVFDSAEPIASDAFDKQGASQEKTHRLRRWCRLIFAGGLIPLTAPLALVAGVIWLATVRGGKTQVAPLDRLLLRLGMGVSAVWVVVGFLTLAFL